MREGEAEGRRKKTRKNNSSGREFIKTLRKIQVISMNLPDKRHDVTYERKQNEKKANRSKNDN